jgi:hypothetical protein
MVVISFSLITYESNCLVTIIDIMLLCEINMNDINCQVFFDVIIIDMY